MCIRDRLYNVIFGILGHIDRSCYCPGENIFITADIQNQTSRDMTALKGKLIQTIIYMAQGHTKRHSQTVAVVEGNFFMRYQINNDKKKFTSKKPFKGNSKLEILAGTKNRQNMK